MTTDLADLAARVDEAIRAAGGGRVPAQISRRLRFVDDLGFDSLRISMLALELEERIGAPILLHEWIEASGQPGGLTVGSLQDFVEAAVARHA
jgi:acyl carrier protein